MAIIIIINLVNYMDCLPPHCRRLDKTIRNQQKEESDVEVELEGRKQIECLRCAAIENSPKEYFPYFTRSI